MNGSTAAFSAALAFALAFPGGARLQAQANRGATTPDQASPTRPLIDVAFPPDAHPPVVEGDPWTGRVIGVPGPEIAPAEKRGGSSSLSTFTAAVSARGKIYPFTMVGSNFSVRGAKNVTVPVQVIPIRFDFPDGTVFDPTAADTGCAGNGVPLDLVLQSPIFQNADYGIGDGPRQFAEEARRMEFAAYVAPGRLNPNYSVRLAAGSPIGFRVTLPAGYQTQDAICGKLGIIDFTSWDKLVRTQIFPQLGRFGVSSHTLPLFLFLNVETSFSDGGHAQGFHTYVIPGRKRGSAPQTYGVAMFDTTQSFQNADDVYFLSHEIMEWLDDPFANNPTPPWGNIGQVRGCQSSLEVGDPLTGTPPIGVDMPNGFHYHLQETAFFSWFFDEVPSLGAGGLYSTAGTFTAPADLCH